VEHRDRDMTEVQVGKLIARFGRSEDGSFVLFALYLFLAMILVGGLAVDILRHDYARTRLQNTIDSATLAAADLNQTLDPTAVVNDYFDKAGVADALDSVEVSETINSRTVRAVAKATIPTWFISAVGVDDLGLTSGGTAREAIQDVEISLVLDVSGSMTRDSKLTHLKTAANKFIDAMLKDGDTNRRVSISIIPYSSQVQADPRLLSQMTVTNRHGYSNCLDFGAGDFQTPAIDPSTSIVQTAHFDGVTSGMMMDESWAPCRTDSDMAPLYLQDDKSKLKDKINDLRGAGNTSVEIGLKWGMGLLDPTMRTALVNSGAADSNFSERPYDYGRAQTIKVLIVMTDGQNTTQYMLDPALYPNVESDVYVGYFGDNWRITIRDIEDGNRDRDGYYNEPYYVPGGDYWRSDPGNWARALTWPEVWANLSVRWHAWSGRADQHYYDSTKSAVYDAWYTDVVKSIGASEKNNRMADMCDTIKANGVVVYSIAFNISEANSTLLKDCASSGNNYFNVTGSQITYAFSAIATTINQLQLIE